MDKADYAETLETWKLGFLELLRKHTKVCGEHAEGVLWRRRNQAEWLGLRLPAESRPQLLLGEHVGQHVQRDCEGRVCIRNERRGHWTGFPQEHRRAKESGLARCRRNLLG